MPIIGTMSEFPLPEIMQLIGQRTGHLRLLDVPEAGNVEIELYKGHLCSLRIAEQSINDINELMKRLSLIIQAEVGMFEFTETGGKEPEQSLRLPMNKLAMDLVFMVDEINGISPAKKNGAKKGATQSLGDTLRKKKKTARFVYDDENAEVPEKIE